MTRDNNKNITAITYNHLNLPTKITFGTTGNIVYLYNAAGQKVRKTVMEGTNETITDYLGGYQYVKEPLLNPTLKFFPTAEGYVEASGSSNKYIYQYKDHLGNIRISYDKTLAIKDENNYYAFGLKHMGYGAPVVNSNYKYKYNGKELQDELGLNMTAMDYRQYDNALGRFNSIDVMCEKFPSLSSYSFSADNPILLNDPSGKDWSISATTDENGNIHISITVNAAIMNSSGKKINMNNYIKNQKAQFNRIFSMSREDFDIKANINLREVKNEGEAKENEHLVNIKDPSDFDDNVGGNSHLGGLNVNINSAFINSDGTTSYNNAFSHEIGHTGGLEHPWEKGDSQIIGKNYIFGLNFGSYTVPKYNQNAVDLKTNFMSYPQNYTNALTLYERYQQSIKISQNPGTATRGQIATIMRYYSNGYLNNNDK
jgi:RHS repeat-associated protein